MTERRSSVTLTLSFLLLGVTAGCSTAQVPSSQPVPAYDPVPRDTLREPRPSDPPTLRRNLRNILGACP